MRRFRGRRSTLSTFGCRARGRRSTLCTGTADFIAGAALEPRSADCVAGAVAHKTKACYVGMVPSSSKFCPPVADKRFATLEWHLLRSNYTVRVAHKKGLLRLVIKGLLQCFTGCMTRFPNHLERVLPRKRRPKYPKTRTKDQRMRGPRDQRTKGPEDQGTRGPTNQSTKGPEEQGTRGPKDQGTREPRDQRIKGPEDQGTRGPRDQGTRTKGAKDQAIREPAGQDQRSRGNSIFDTNYCLLIGNNCIIDRNQFF